MRHGRIFIAVLALLFACGRAAGAETVSGMEAREIAREAYIFTFPLFEMYRTRWGAIEYPANPRRTVPNKLNHRRDLADHRARAVTTPNNDTLYSSAFLDLLSGPVQLDMPEVKGRYISIAFMDFYTNNFAYLGTRTTGGQAGKYLIAGPAWKGELPAGATLIRAPTAQVWMLGRILVDDAADLPNVHRIQDAITLTPQPDAAAAPPGPPPVNSEPARFIAAVNHALSVNPPPTAASALLARMARIGIGPGLPADVRSEEVTAAIAAGFEAARAEIRADATRYAARENGWAYMPAHLGNFGEDYLYRASVALSGLAALEPVEAMYMRHIGIPGAPPLDGRTPRVLRFRAEEVPAVNAFWSLSLYEPTPEGRLFFTDNPIGRYAIGDRTKGLKRGPDGGIEILISHERSADTANWLPAPAGPYVLTMRAYLPRPEMLARERKLPAVQ